MSRLVFRRPIVCLIIGGEFELETRQLAGLWPVSALTLGGGGVGQLWGETTRDECVATVRAAMDSGITLLDMAPRYGDGEAELVVGEAFDAKLPEGVRVSTEHRLGTPAPGEVEDNLISSLEESLERMRLDRVDLFFLHSNIIPDDYDASAYTDRPATRWKIYAEQIVPGYYRHRYPHLYLGGARPRPKACGRAMYHQLARLAGRPAIFRWAKPGARHHR